MSKTKVSDLIHTVLDVANSTFGNHDFSVDIQVGKILSVWSAALMLNGTFYQSKDYCEFEEINESLVSALKGLIKQINGYVPEGEDNSSEEDDQEEMTINGEVWVKKS